MPNQGIPWVYWQRPTDSLPAIRLKLEILDRPIPGNGNINGAVLTLNGQGSIAGAGLWPLDSTMGSAKNYLPSYH